MVYGPPLGSSLPQDHDSLAVTYGLPDAGARPGLPRIAGPLIIYIGTNGHSGNFLGIGSSAPYLFREPAGAAVSHFSVPKSSY
jgi:hypothetical protein